MSKFISSADTNITVTGDASYTINDILFINTDDTGTITVNSITFGANTAAGKEYIVEGWVKLA